MNKGKNFANRKPIEQRPSNDFYETPYCMTEELINTGVLNNVKTIWDPCCGNYAILKVLEKHGYNCFGNDIIYGDDYFAHDYQHHECVVMNPPFKLFDKFIAKAKQEADLVCAIGKANYFGSHSRNINNLWSNLREVYFFDRQIAFDKPLREDGKVECGMMITGWFVWDMKYTGKPTINVIDMQKYILKKKGIN